MAIAGIALSGLGLLLACANAIAGVVFAPEIERLLDELMRASDLANLRTGRTARKKGRFFFVLFSTRTNVPAKFAPIQNGP